MATETQVDTVAEQIGRASRALELRDPDEGQPLIDRIANRLVEVVGVSVLVAIVLVIFANAVSRYLFSHSFIWAEEMVQMAMPWLAMTGVFLSVRRRTMIRIDYFFERMPTRWQAPVANFGFAVCVAVLLFMAWSSYQFVRLFGGDVALYIEIPVGWSTSALAFGALGAALAFLIEFFREQRARRAAAQAKGMNP